MTAHKTARAEVRPRRQRTQYSCMACSMAMCLTANGIDADEDTVNEVMGAQPMRGAAWEQALACAQHYGMRATLTVPATLSQVKAWTDKGVPVMIAWNPEGREWSHASVVVDVVADETHGFLVHVADPNIPDPEQTIRVVTKDEFYKKWYEKWPNYLVRRPAMAVEREVTTDGRQVMASSRQASIRVAEEYDCYKDYRAGRISKSEYYQCLAHIRKQERREYERAQASRDAIARMWYYYTIQAEKRGLDNVKRWIDNMVRSHAGHTRDYVPQSVAQKYDVSKIFARTVPTNNLTPDELAEWKEIAARHPDLTATAQNVQDTEAMVLAQAQAESDRLVALEAAAAAREEIATERARPYAVDPKYRKNWTSYSWADGDMPLEWRWNYIDDDGVYAHVSATMSRGLGTKEIESGRASVVVYKFPPEVTAKFRRDLDVSQVPHSLGELVSRGVIRTRDPEQVIPRTMPFILKLKGEHGFDDDDLESQAKLMQERRRQEAIEAERAEAEARRQRQNKVVVDSALAEKFSILDTLIARGDAAAKASASEVKAVYESGGTPTEDQLKRLRNMLYRSRMRDEANHFRVASIYVEAKRPTPVQQKKDQGDVRGPGVERRNPVVQQMIERGSAGAGKHHNREDDVEKGRSRKPKHKQRWEDRDAEVLTAAWNKGAAWALNATDLPEK